MSNIRVTATITTDIPFTDEGFGTPEHSVDLEASLPAPPEDLVTLAFVLGIKSSLFAVAERSDEDRSLILAALESLTAQLTEV